MYESEVESTLESALDLGLSESEFDKIKDLIGRVPNLLELRIISRLWSEQVSYKSAVNWLNSLPFESKNIISGGGYKDAGLYDLGDGNILAFYANTYSISETNELSLIDHISVNDSKLKLVVKCAKPAVELRSYCYKNHPQTPFKLSTDSFIAADEEVPLIDTEMHTHKAFPFKTAVSNFSIGRVKFSKLAFGRPLNNGDLVYLIKDSLHKREADFCIDLICDLIDLDVVTGLRLIEKGGMVNTFLEECNKFNLGVTIESASLENKDASEDGMTAILFDAYSGSLLVFVDKEAHEKFELTVNAKGLYYCKIGSITDTEEIEICKNGNVLASIPVNLCITGAGIHAFDPKYSKPKHFGQIKKFIPGKIRSPENLLETAKKLFASPNMITKLYLLNLRSRKEDFQFLSDSVLIENLIDNNEILASTDCNPFYTYADPFAGGMIAITEAARKIACSGGVPMAVSLSLNFGASRNPEFYYQFANCVKGIGEACRKFDIPVCGAQVTFDEATMNPSYLPIPFIGMIGRIEDNSSRTSLDFKNEGDLIYMIGNLSNSIGSSEYVRFIHNIEYSPVPEFDLYEESEIQKHVRQLIRRSIVQSAHGVSQGGLFFALMECSLVGGFGFNIETVDTFKLDCFLFGESQSRIIISIAPDQEDNLQNYLINNNVSFTKLGEVFGNEMVIDDKKFGSISSWKRIYEDKAGEFFSKN